MSFLSVLSSVFNCKKSRETSIYISHDNAAKMYKISKPDIRRLIKTKCVKGDKWLVNVVSLYIYLVNERNVKW